MRSFGDYINDQKVNVLYYGAKKFAEPDFFMSFTEATWDNAISSKATPNGIIVFNILETIDKWVDVDGVKTFPLFKGKQKKLYILKAKHSGREYTEELFQADIVKLQELYDFKPNEKLLRNLERAGLYEAAKKEKERFKTMVNEATHHLTDPDKKLWEVTKWIAAGNRDPSMIFPDNAPQRWNNILRKIGYNCLADQDTAIFLDVNAFEVIDEIRN